jgi:hypothetical protein
MTKLAHTNVWKENSVHYTKRTIGTVIGPLFFGWIPLIVLGNAITMYGSEILSQGVKPIVFVVCSWTVCLYAMTLRRVVLIDFKENTLATGWRHFFWLVKTTKSVPENSRIIFDVHEGKVASSMSKGTDRKWSGTQLYGRLRIQANNVEKTVWEQLCSPPVGNYLFIKDEYHQIGQSIAKRMGINFEGAASDDEFVLDIPPLKDFTESGIDIKKESKENARNGIGFCLLFAVIFGVAGAKICTETMVMGILILLLSCAFFFGVFYMMLFHNSFDINKDTGTVAITKGWKWKSRTRNLSKDEQSRIVIHPINGDAPRKSSNGHTHLSSFPFAIKLYLENEYHYIASPNSSHFADQYLYAQTLANTLEVKIQLLGSGSVTAYKKLLEREALSQ